MEELIQDIKNEDLPEIYSELAECIGKENALKLGLAFAGVYLYIPKLDKLIIPLRNSKIIKEYNGYNIKQLAIKYGLTEYWIRNILKRNPVT
ncbi:hypothetical protein JT05_00050 [Desulfosporosinus sp. Tol-M]|nr:hypothetical protein JT05_00050 [Desulfosporosinus sp. Tol-M]